MRRDLDAEPVCFSPRRDLLSARSLCVACAANCYSSTQVPKSMGAGASAAKKKKKAAAAAAAAAADSPKKVDDKGKNKAVDPGGVKVDEVAAGAPAEENGDAVGKDDSMDPCKMSSLYLGFVLYMAAMVSTGKSKHWYSQHSSLALVV